MSTRVIDFDQFRAEQKEEPVEFKIGGEVYNLPPALPAAMALDVMRMQEMQDEDDEVPPEILDQIGRSLFGETMWVSLLQRHRITVDEIGPLMEKVVDAYTAPPKEEPGEPTSETPESDSASSETGRRSRRTSSASTAST